MLIARQSGLEGNGDYVGTLGGSLGPGSYALSVRTTCSTDPAGACERVVELEVQTAFGILALTSQTDLPTNRPAPLASQPFTITGGTETFARATGGGTLFTQAPGRLEAVGELVVADPDAERPAPQPSPVSIEGSHEVHTATLGGGAWSTSLVGVLRGLTGADELDGRYILLERGSCTPGADPQSSPACEMVVTVEVTLQDGSFVLEAASTQISGPGGERSALAFTLVRGAGAYAGATGAGELSYDLSTLAVSGSLTLAD